MGLNFQDIDPDFGSHGSTIGSKFKMGYFEFFHITVMNGRLAGINF